MPHYIVKVAPERDAYLEWSTIVDSPVATFTRATAVAAFGEERVARTDQNGTSALYFDWLSGSQQSGGWDDSEQIVYEAAEETR